MKKIICLTFLFLLPLFVSADVSHAPPHKGEKVSLEYSIEYLHPLGETITGATGLTFLPFAGGFAFLATLLPERYFGSYPLYFSGGTMEYRVYITNLGPRTFKNLSVTAVQEYLNPSGEAGDEIDPGVKDTWFVETLGSEETVVLSGDFVIPLIGISGLDQTHLVIRHKPQRSRGDGKGQIIIDDPQAGIWCPLVP